MLDVTTPSDFKPNLHPGYGLAQLARASGSQDAALPAISKQSKLWAAAATILVCVWLPRLCRSFWVDEAGTFLMAHNGPLAAIRFTSHWPGQSMLYAAIASVFAINEGPFREFLLRIPTLAGVLLAAFFLFHLAEKAIGKGAGFLAAVLFVFHPVIVDLGTQARPYGLALAAVCASCLALVRWVDTRRERYLIGYVLASALVIYLHYFFSVVFVSHFAYLGYVILFEKRRSAWQQLLLAYASLAVIISPLIPHLRLLLHEAHTLPFTPPPSPVALYEALLPAVVALGVITACFLAQFFFPNSFRKPKALSRSVSCLFFSWWVAAPTIFFVLSIATPMRAFIPR